MAINMSVRQDVNNYAEGTSVGDMIVRGLGKYSWLQAGVTYTNYTLSDAGVLFLPIITGSQGASTAICADGNVGTADADYLSVIIDKKVSGKFDGCFTVAGISDKKIERALNNFKLKNMQNDFQDDVLTYILATATASAVVKAGSTAYEYLNALQLEYFAANEEFPEIALVSLAFYNELLLEKIALGVLSSDEAYVSGNVGKVLGMNLTVVPRLTRDAVVYVADALAIAKPASPAVIGENILGAVDSDSDAFYEGMVSIQAKDALKGIAETYVHKFYGKGIPVAARVLVTPVIV